MFEFLFGSRRPPSKKIAPAQAIARHARLGVETLESRDCPSAPAITLSVKVLADHEVRLSGVVSGAEHAGAVVTFSGAVSGTTTAGAKGRFSFTTSDASLGTVDAVAVNGSGASTNVAAATIAVAAPTISMHVTNDADGIVTIAGKVTDPHLPAAGLPVTISGVENETVECNAKGLFSFTVSASDEGEVDVSTTDVWGQSSNTAEIEVPDFPPVIRDFRVTEDASGCMILRGTVIGPDVAGLTVTFGGLDGLCGQTTTVRANGTFVLVVHMPEEQIGTATAQVTDQWGQESNTVMQRVG